MNKRCPLVWKLYILLISFQSPYRAAQVRHRVTKPINLPQPSELHPHYLLPPFTVGFTISWNGLAYETVPSDGALCQCQICSLLSLLVNPIRQSWALYSLFFLCCRILCDMKVAITAFVLVCILFTQKNFDALINIKYKQYCC